MRLILLKVLLPLAIIVALWLLGTKPVRRDELP